MRAHYTLLDLLTETDRDTVRHRVLNWKDKSPYGGIFWQRGKMEGFL